MNLFPIALDYALVHNLVDHFLVFDTNEVIESRWHRYPVVLRFTRRGL